MRHVSWGDAATASDPENIDYSVQLLAPEEGDDIATFETSLGDITVVLYTDEVPEVVQNFKDLVNEGFFDGQVIYQVVPTVGAAMFGSSTEDGNTPDTNTGSPLEAQYSDSLWPFSGSLTALCSEMGPAVEPRLLLRLPLLLYRRCADGRGDPLPDGGELFPSDDGQRF